MRINLSALCALLIAVLLSFVSAQTTQADIIISADNDFNGYSYGYGEGGNGNGNGKGNGNGNGCYDKIAKGDLFTLDIDTTTASVVIEGDIFGRSGNIDAAHMLPGGRYVLSTQGKTELAGLVFDKGDLVEYDPLSGTANKFFDGSLFDKKEDIDAVYVQASGAIVMSTAGSAELGDLKFDCDDIIRYDRNTGSVAVLFDGNMFDKKNNIDAVHMLENGDLVFSTDKSGKIGGLAFDDNDLIRYSPVTQTASLYQSIGNQCGKNKGDAFDVDALTMVSVGGGDASIPEPATLSLLGLGGLILLRKRVRRA